MKLFSIKNKNKKKVLFLDRDGVINKDKAGEYITDIGKVKIYSSALKALKEISETQKYLLIIITNQSAVGRGFITLNRSKEINYKILKILKKNGIKISALYYCPHSPEYDCSCRKPKTGMIKEAFKDFNIDKKGSFLIGDKKSDIQTAVNAGLKSVLVMTGQGKKTLSQGKISYNFKIKDLRGLKKII
ncbi:MAG: HAD family hydrolase [Elusimicrobiota bacterium]